MNEREAWLALNAIPNLGSISFQRLLSAFGSAKDAFSCPPGDLVALAGIGDKIAESINGFDIDAFLKKEIKLINQYKVKIILADDEGYPKLLKQIYAYPMVLYVRGQLDYDYPYCLAIIGTRYPTNYGRSVVKKFSKELADLGITIVSGLARGIDSLAHQGAIDSQARTIAVLGCGVDIIYPPENKNLMDRIIGQGAVISEFSMSTTPERYNFPLRNRIISGLSFGTLVIEAAAKSGTLITVNYALEQGREIFAVPGNINSKNSQGTNSLIKQGAKLVNESKDILEEIAPQLLADLKERTQVDGASLLLEQEEKIIYQTLNNYPIHIDEITRKSSLPVNKVLGLLTTLELKGVIEQVPGNNFKQKM